MPTPIEPNNISLNLFKLEDLNQLNTNSTLDNIQPIKAVTTTAFFASGENPMSFSASYERLKNISSSLKNDITEKPLQSVLNGLKAIWKGAAIGAVNGLVFGGLGGFFGGLFLGAALEGIGKTINNTVNAFRHNLKVDLLRSAYNNPGENVGLEKTSVFYTNGQKQVNFSKMGDTLKDQESAIAITMMNTKVNKNFHAKLTTLNLSQNSKIVNEQFLVKLMCLSTGEYTPEGGQPQLVNGLSGLHLNLTETSINSEQELLNAMNQTDELNTIQLTEIPNLSTSSNDKPKAVKLSWIPKNTSNTVEITMSVDPSFKFITNNEVQSNPRPTQSEITSDARPRSLTNTRLEIQTQNC